MARRMTEFRSKRAPGAALRTTSEQTAEAFVEMHRQRIQRKLVARRPTSAEQKRINRSRMRMEVGEP